jgi:hypothetical protein
MRHDASNIIMHFDTGNLKGPEETHRILRITHTVMIDRHSCVPDKVGIYQK